MIQLPDWDAHLRFLRPEEENIQIEKDIHMLQQKGELPSLEGRIILDIGTGTGHPVAVLKKLGAYVIACDRDKERIKCGIKHGYLKPRDAVFCDLQESVPFREESVEALFGFHIGRINSVYGGIQQLWKTIFDHTVQLLKPDGYVCFSYRLEEGDISVYLKKLGVTGYNYYRANGFDRGLANTIYCGRKRIPTPPLEKS